MIKRFIFIISFFTCIKAIELLPFNKVIIWGYPLHSHTHSYIHYAFHKAFRFLGYDTYWVTDSTNMDKFDFSNSLFITMGDTVNKKMPVRTDCTYILHNCDAHRFKKVLDSGNAIQLQVYTHDALKNHTDVEKIDTCMYYSLRDKVIYLPWATDLLPDEIEQQKQQNRNIRNNAVSFVGSIYGGMQGNVAEITRFMRACKKNNVHFEQRQNLSESETISRIQQSYMAPAIQGEWQCKQGYIPCRIFKNISYGQWGITNSKTVYELFNGAVTYNPDCYRLFFDAKKKLQSLTEEELFKVMDFVKEKHTYINRIDELFKFIKKIKNAHT